MGRNCAHRLFTFELRRFQLKYRVFRKEALFLTRELILTELKAERDRLNAALAALGGVALPGVEGHVKLTTISSSAVRPGGVGR